MAKADMYDPKSRTLSKTIYHNHYTDNTAAGQNINVHPFPVAYGNAEGSNTGPASIQTCVIDFNHAELAAALVDQTYGITLSNWSGDPLGNIAYIGPIPINTHAAATYFEAGLGVAFTNGHWAHATGTAGAAGSTDEGKLTITWDATQVTTDVQIDLLNHNSNTITNPISGGTAKVLDGQDYVEFAYTPAGSGTSTPTDYRDYAEGLVKGGSNYTVQVVQGA